MKVIAIVTGIVTITVIAIEETLGEITKVTKILLFIVGV
jgi:hypothetical protein